MIWLGRYTLNICTKNSLHSGSMIQRRSSVCSRMVYDGTGSHGEWGSRWGVRKPSLRTAEPWRMSRSWLWWGGGKSEPQRREERTPAEGTVGVRTLSLKGDLKERPSIWSSPTEQDGAGTRSDCVWRGGTRGWAGTLRYGEVLGF